MGLWHFRFAALYLVLLNVGITLYFRYALRRTASDVSALGSSVRFAITGVWVALMAVYTLLPDLIVLWDFEPWMPLRWSRHRASASNEHMNQPSSVYHRRTMHLIQNPNRW